MLKFILFALVLIYASWYDIKHLIVPTHVHILLLVTGLLGVSLSSFIGLITAFAPLFLSALVVNKVHDNGIGGGDVKFAGMCGFVMQNAGGLIGIIIGFILALIIVPLNRKIFKRKATRFALIPFISAGCLITYIIGGI